MALLLAILWPSWTYSENQSALLWNRTYITKYTRDVVTGISPDRGNGFLYLCGQAYGPRLMDASFKGMIYNNAMDAANSPPPQVEQNFTDGTVTKLDISNGKVLYSYRGTEASSGSHVHTTITAIKLSPSNKYLFAVGNERRYNVVTSSGIPTVKDWTFIRMFKAHANEGPFAEHKILTEDYALSSTPVVDATEDALILCSTIIPIEGKSFSVITKLMPLVYTESLLWVSWRVRLSGASCTALTIASGGERVFIGGGLDDSAGVWHLSAKTGYVFWSRKLETSSGMKILSAPLAIKEHNGCVYTSVHLTSATNVETTAIFKLSANYGTVIWYAVTCCAQLNSSQATGIPHSLLVEQGSVIHVVHTNETLLVAQVSTHGRVGRLKAVSGITPNEVRHTRAVTLNSVGSVHEAFVLSETWENGQAYAKVMRIILEHEGTGLTGITGEDDVEEIILDAMVRLSARVDVMRGAGTSLAAVCDMTAEAVGGDMESATVSGTDGMSGDQEGYGEFVMNVRGSDVGSVVVKIYRVMREIFERQGIERSKMETQLNVSENRIMLVNFSIQALTQGAIGQQRAAHGRAEQATQDDLKGAVRNGATTVWIAIGFMAIGVASVAIVVAAVLSAQGLAETEANDVEEGFDGKPIRGTNDSNNGNH